MRRILTESEERADIQMKRTRYPVEQIVAAAGQQKRGPSWLEFQTDARTDIPVFLGVAQMPTFELIIRTNA